MKRFFLFLSFIIVLALVVIYGLIPARPEIKVSALIYTNVSVTSRIVGDENWQQWWPMREAEEKEAEFRFRNSEFRIKDKLLSGLEVVIKNGKDSFDTFLDFIPQSLDTVKIDWLGTVAATYSPLKRIEQYIHARQAQQNMRSVIDTLKSFLEIQTNTYGMHIVEERVTDTLLITIKRSSLTYPSVAYVYELVNKLRNYATSNGLAQTNYPMLNVMKEGKNDFTVMVGLPVDHEVKAEDDIKYKRMAPGKILVSEIKGGPSTIKGAFEQFDLFLQDYHRISPAIPFESMVTDRSHEPDTTKWVTKVYYPVF
jgi:effector-binding domain-containing protein